MKKILIFGSGSHSKVVLSEILRIKNYKVIGFVDEKLKKGTVVGKFGNKTFKVICNISKLKSVVDKNTHGVIAIGSNFIRKKITNKVEKILKNFNWEKIISKNCIINGNVKIGKGTVIISGAVINTGCIIGKHCLINTSSSIDHDNIFKNFSSCGPNVTTGGNVLLGECSYLGISSTVKHMVKVGDNTVIGCQSMVTKNCKNNSLYFGIPAKKIRNRKMNEEYLQ
jgi:sugar O-acyltransferase (sialic acid O-acetyltransferase NeuD family)